MTRQRITKEEALKLPIWWTFGYDDKPKPVRVFKETEKTIVIADEPWGWSGSQVWVLHRREKKRVWDGYFPTWEEAIQVRREHLELRVRDAEGMLERAKAKLAEFDELVDNNFGEGAL